MTKADDSRPRSEEILKRSHAEFARISRDSARLIMEFLEGKAVERPHGAYVEAWITLALYEEEGPVPLERLVERATLIQRDYPSTAEVVWGVVSISRRGWLIVDQGKYALSGEGANMVSTIISGIASEWKRVTAIQQWMATHSPLPR